MEKANFNCGGQVYHLAFNLRIARRLAVTCGIDVLNFNEYPRILESLGVRLEMIWFLVQDQAKEDGINSLDDFEAALCDPSNPDAITQASNALQESLVFFYRKLNQIPLQMMAEANLEVMIEAQKALPEQMDGYNSLKEKMKAGAPKL